MAISDKNIRITKNTNTALGAGNGPKMVFTGAAAGSSVITLEVLDDNSISFSSNEGQIFALDSNLSEGIIWSVNNISATPILSASAGSTIGLANFGGLVGVGTVAPQYKLHVQGGSVGIATTNAAVQFLFDNNSASGSNFLAIRNANSLRFFNANSTNYTGLKAGNNAGDYTLTLPTAAPGAGVSVLVSDSAGTLTWAAAGTGISFAAGTIRQLRPLILTFASGYTPPVSGADSVVLRVPDSSRDGTTATTYILREFHIRAETPSAGSSRIQLEKSTGDGVFTAVNMLAGSGLTLIGAGIYTTQTQNFAGSHVTSNDFLRLNWTLLSSTHANFSAYLEMEEV